MANLILPRRFTQQPQYPVEVVSDLQDGLLCAYMPHVGDPANRNIPLTTPTAISDRGDLSCYRTGAADDIARYVPDPVDFTLTWLQYDTAAVGYGYFIKIWRFSDFESIKVYRNWTYNRSVLEFRVQPSSTKSLVPGTDWLTLGKRSVETIVRTGDTVKWFSNRKLVGSTTGIGTTALGIYGTPYLQLGQTGGHNVGAVLFHGKALPEAQIAEFHSNYYGRAFRRRPQVLYFDVGGGGTTPITASDTLAPSLTESQVSALSSSISDSFAPSLTEAAALLKNPELIVASESLTVSLTEALALYAESAVVDTLAPSITDSAVLDTGTGTAEKNVTETLAVSVTDAQASSLTSAVTDTLTPSATDVSAVIAALLASDTITPSLTEAQQSTLYAAVLEAFTLTLGESVGSALYSSVTDVIPVSVTDSVSLLVARTVTDTLVVSITDSAVATAISVTAKDVSEILAPYFTEVASAEIYLGWDKQAAVVGIWTSGTAITGTWVKEPPV